MALVVGLYDTLHRAQAAVVDLVDSGFPRRAVSMLLRGIEPGSAFAHMPAGTLAGDGDAHEIVSASGRRLALIAAGPLAESLERARSDAGYRDGEGRVSAVLCAAGLSRFAATYFNEAICDGGVLVAVQCEDSRIRDARDILDTHAPDGFDEWAVPFCESAPARSPPLAHVNGKNTRS
jgi:hypothetical protein